MALSYRCSAIPFPAEALPFGSVSVSRDRLRGFGGLAYIRARLGASAGQHGAHCKEWGSRYSDTDRMDASQGRFLVTAAIGQACRG